MTQRLSHHVLLLAVATFLLDLIALRELGTHQFPHPAAIAVLGMAWGQIGLAALYLALGRQNVLFRLAITLGGIGLMVPPLARATIPNAAQWLGVLCAYAAVVAVPLAIMRLRRHVMTPAPVSSEGLGRWQFSLAGMMILTTFIAVLLGVGRHCHFPETGVLLVAACCVGFALVTLGTFWSVFRWEDPWAKIITAVLLGPVVGGALGLLCGSSHAVLPFAAMSGIQGIWLVLSLTIVRVQPSC